MAGVLKGVCSLGASYDAIVSFNRHGIQNNFQTNTSFIKLFFHKIVT